MFRRYYSIIRPVSLVMSLLLVLFFVSSLQASPAAGATAYELNHFMLHPNLWPLTTANGTFSWTNKRFKAGKTINSTYTNTEHAVVVSWSGPGDGTYRDVHYASPEGKGSVGDSGNCYTDTSGEGYTDCNESRVDWEWEKWTYNWTAQTAAFHRYGGTKSSEGFLVYDSVTKCAGNGATGASFPTVYANTTYNVAPFAVKDPNYNQTADHCRPDINNAPNGRGGYLGVYRHRDGQSEDRTAFCNDFFGSLDGSMGAPNNRYNIYDGTNAHIARKICQSAPNVEAIFQGYVWGTANEAAYPVVIGCEAVVYASGYAQPSSTAAAGSNEVKNWFRNGELRLSRYFSPSNQSYINPSNAAEWVNRCNTAFQESVKEQWFYTGVYRLNNSIYFDNGTTSLPTLYSSASCPTGMTPNSSGSCEPREGSWLASGACPTGFVSVAYTFGSSTRNKCIGTGPNYP